MHQWVLSKSFMTDRYGHEKFTCNCGKTKHIKYFWNRKPIVVIIPKTNDK
jgi:hypothetical protein